MLLRCLGVIALAATGCTLDYDALIAGAGGGDGTTSTGDATSTSGASTSTTTATTASGSTATTAGSTSSGDGGGGGAGGGDGGAGGTGGAGGAGGELPFSEPCEGLAITWSDDLETSLGDAWEESDGNDVTPTTDPQTGLTITLGGEPDSDEHALIQTVSDEALFECSVTVAVTTIDPDEPEEGFVETGVAAGDRGIQLRIERGDGGVSCEVRAGALLTEDVDVVDCTGEAPERLLRIRHTGDELCFDMGLDGEPFEQVGPCHPVDGGRRVFAGASAETAARVTFGKIH